MKRWASLFAGAVLAVTASHTSAQPALGIGTSGQGTMTYTLGSAVAGLLGEKAQRRAVVQPQAGTGVAVPLVNAGELDITFASAIEASQAFNGTGEYSRKNPNLRIVGRLFTTRVSLMVRKDSGIKSLQDLRGRTVTYGYTSTPVFQDVISAILANGGVSTEEIKPVMVPSLIRGADDFAAGNIDAAFFAIGAGKVAEVNSTTGGIRFLPLSDSPDAVARMQSVLPLTYMTPVKPAAPLAGILEPMQVMGYDYLVVAAEHVSDDAVYALTRAIAENKDYLVQSFGGFRSLNRETMGSNDYGIPYHKGAVRYYEEQGLLKAN